MNFNNVISINKTLFKILSENHALTKKLRGIYAHVPQNATFPYIHLGKVSLIDHSTKTSRHAKAFFNITIYSRDKGPKEAMSIMALAEGIIASRLKFVESKIELTKDGVTYKLTTTYTNII